jgi:hypothetical protein
MNCTIECYLALSKGVGLFMLTVKTDLCALVVLPACNRILPKDACHDKLFEHKVFSFCTDVPHMSSFNIVVYMLRYILVEFFDVHVRLETCHVHSRYITPVRYLIKSFLKKILQCYFLSSSL